MPPHNGLGPDDGILNVLNVAMKHGERHLGVGLTGHYVKINDIDGSLALASLNLACRNLVPAFPQRSPPSLLTTAACGGLRPEPDCRPRRALLHLSYSSAPPYSRGAFVTHDPQRNSPRPVGDRQQSE